MLRIYSAPDGRTYQYEEGSQPDGFVPVGEPKAAPRAAKKRRTASHKRRAAAANKSEGGE